MKNTDLRPGLEIVGQVLCVTDWRAYINSATPEQRENLQKLIDYGKRNLKPK